MTTSNEDMLICARCGGQCCLTRPGIEAPERFLRDGSDLASSLAASLASGKWVLEEHWGIPYEPGTESPDPDRLIRYPRPATVHEFKQPGFAPASDSGACVFLSAKGCELPFEERPRLCRELLPDVCFECESPWGRREAALEWLPWQEQVAAAISCLIDPARRAG